MNSDLLAYITLICTSGVLNLYLVLYVFFKRHKYSSIIYLFTFYMLFINIYCFAAAFGLMATSLEQIKMWTIIQYIGMPFSAPLGLLFIIHYLGIKITKEKSLLFLIIPFISFIMVLTNDWHEYYYRVFEVDIIRGAPFVYQEVGFWYVVHGIYTFSCMFVALILLISNWKETSKAYRPQLLALMLGQIIPMFTAFIYLLGWTPSGIDPVPMVLWLTSLLYLWSISSTRLFTIMPIAKDTIFNNINDGVMVLDESQRLIEFNRECKRMFPHLHKSMLGKDVKQVWSECTSNSFPIQLEVMNQELKLADAIYQVRVSSLEHMKSSKGLLIIFTDITELKNLQARLESLAYFDELTQVFNRRAFFQQCEKEYAAAKENARAFTIILMDIDYFKNVNDTYGHSVGDQLLVHVTQVCQTHLKKEELFGRYGGEEFVLALKGYTKLDAKVLANSIRKDIESKPLNGTIPITASFGVAEALGGESVFQLLNEADKALYSAKESGRNQVKVYNKHHTYR